MKNSYRQIIFFKSDGKGKTIHISIYLLYIVIAFLALFILSSILIINNWLKLRQMIPLKELEVQKLKIQNDALSDALEQKEVYIAFLKEEIKGLRGEKDKTQRAQFLSNKSKEGKAVEIRDMDIRMSRRYVRFSFRLQNNRGQDNPIKGFVHVMLLDSDGTPLGYYPKGVSKDTEYKKGIPFYIRNFKTIWGKINIKDRLPKTLRCLIYDLNGNILLKARFKIKNSL